MVTTAAVSKERDLPVSFASLPVDLCFMIFRRLEFDDLLRVSLVCRQWKAVAEDASRFKKLLRVFNGTVTSTAISAESPS